ncbi:elongation factor Ts [Methylopila jiangsuensis]|uniref:Elongation factor Ts n=1 Tax=Methylopila jiangsuensis TaxID=586230 RepID=A0A9W6JGF7_9HYPH|nr:translation elongation factor Ts [Methylopila jiangsuensis]MDR6285620.1 elongation factor Ts [Methylopila jiangsuensis]GLK75380.1 elongation factor Ts [Methylopila jiangsuensis]
MANITAAMVKELREKTGAGMMDCKNALAEVDGDIEAAVDWLRKKGLAKAAKKAGRVAAEGLVALAVDGAKGVAVEVNSETDFVARNPEFQDMVSSIATVALTAGAETAAIEAAAYPGGGTVAEKVQATIGKIGENMTLRRAAALSVSQGVIGSYVHGQVAPNLGKIAVLVGLESEGKAEALSALGRQVAMHVAATNPQGLDSSSIDPAIVEREKGVLASKARESGKPENVIEKIVESGIKTFFKEATLVEQPFIHDGSKTVAQAIKAAEAEVGAPIKLTGFVRLALGEGVEKEESDFAAEVAAAAGTR